MKDYELVFPGFHGRRWIEENGAYKSICFLGLVQSHKSSPKPSKETKGSPIKSLLSIAQTSPKRKVVTILGEVSAI
mgnify:CR=1 FL=1